MMQRIQCTFASDHPASVGHFPGNPIIPGAVLLNEILTAIGGAGDASQAFLEMPSAKLLHPVRPGETVEVSWEMRANGEARFECRLVPGNRMVLTGSFKTAGERI